MKTTTGENARASHTPGPWVVDDMYTHNGARVRISAHNGRSDYYLRCPSIAECHFRERNDDVVEGPLIVQAEANARLIAAAPDLLYSLVGLLNHYVRLVNSGDAGNWDPEKEHEVRAARAAIAKAEGRS